MDTVDHAALRAEIDAAKAEASTAFHAMWHAMNTGTNEEYAARLEEWRAANNALDALIKAGVLVTLGPLEGDPRDGEVQP